MGCGLVWFKSFDAESPVIPVFIREKIMDLVWKGLREWGHNQGSAMPLQYITERMICKAENTIFQGLYFDAFALCEDSRACCQNGLILGILGKDAAYHTPLSADHFFQQTLIHLEKLKGCAWQPLILS
jgi:hypothetical protein